MADSPAIKDVFVIQLRGDLAANWVTRNPILAKNEAGREEDTDRIKYGDGAHAWNDLPYHGMIPSATLIHQILLAANPGYSVIVTGPKVTGSEPPQMPAAVLAQVAVYRTIGIPDENVLWNVSGEVGEGVLSLTVNSTTIQLVVDGITIVQASGIFTVSSALANAGIDALTLTPGNLFSVDGLNWASALSSVDLIGNFILAAETVTPIVDVVSLSGNFIIDGAATLCTVDNLVITSVGNFVIAAVTATPVVDNVPMIGNLVLNTETAALVIDNVVLLGLFTVNALTSTATVANMALDSGGGVVEGTDFETGLNGWTLASPGTAGATFARSTDRPITGTYSLKYTGFVNAPPSETLQQIYIHKAVTLNAGLISFKFKAGSNAIAYIQIGATQVVTGVEGNGGVQTVSYSNTIYTGSQTVLFILVAHDIYDGGADEYLEPSELWLDDIVIP